MPAVDDHLTTRARARIGTVLDEKWRLDALLGIGGMAAVFAATHRNGKRAAVKILHAEAALNPSVKTRFLREGYLANKVGHPGAVSILDDDIAADGSVFLVMELLEGETLDSRWLRQNRALSEGDVLSIAEQVLDVLGAAHRKQIVHRDLKPHNLFLTTDGTLKVLDFGIARLGDTNTENARGTTSFSSSMGTLGFMPPEQARGRWEQVDARTDLWALGATMFSLLTGRTVHEALTANERLLAAMTKAADPIASVLPGISPAVARVVDKALAFESKDRWKDAESMQLAVRAAYEEVTGRAIALAPRLSVPHAAANVEVATAPTMLATSQPALTTGQRRLRSRGVIVACAAAALAAVVAIAWGMRDGANAPRASTALASSSATATPSAASMPGSSNATSTATPASTAATTSPVASSGTPATASADIADAASAPTPAALRAGPRARFDAGVSAAAATPASASAAPAESVDLFGRRR